MKLLVVNTPRGLGSFGGDDDYEEKKLKLGTDLFGGGQGCSQCWISTEKYFALIAYAGSS